MISRSASRGTRPCSTLSRCSTRTPTLASITRCTCSATAAASDCAGTDDRRAEANSASTDVGLDHVAFGCANRGELEKWALRLDELGVIHGGIKDASYGSGVSFRDPDGIPLEFFAPPA